MAKLASQQKKAREVVGYRRERDRIKDRNVLCEHVYKEGQCCSFCPCFLDSTTALSARTAIVPRGKQPCRRTM